MILEEGQILFSEGDIGKHMYIVRSGELQGSNTRNTDVNTYGPGALIGELGLLKSEVNLETVIATEDCELQVITQQSLEKTLDQEPSWFKSIIGFLTGRHSIAQSNKRKSDKIKAFPSLLYELKAQLQASPAEAPLLEIPLNQVAKGVRNLFNVGNDDVLALLNILQDLEMVKIQGQNIYVPNPHLLSLLYETIVYRARHKKTPPQILSITEQMSLNAFIKTVQQNREPLQNGIFTIKTEDLQKTAKKFFHGMTLTTRTLLPLIQRQLVNPSEPLDSTKPLPDLDSIPHFFGDFDKILDLMELNRVFPLLDKKLVE